MGKNFSNNGTDGNEMSTDEFQSFLDDYINGGQPKPTANVNTPKSKIGRKEMSIDEFQSFLDDYINGGQPKADNNSTSNDPYGTEESGKEVVSRRFKEVASLTAPVCGLPVLYRTMRKRKFKSYGKEITRYLDDFERMFLKKDPSTNLISTENDSRTGFVLKEHKKKSESSINYYYGQVKNGLRHGYGICEFGDFLNKGLFVGYFEDGEFREGLDYNFTKNEYFFGHYIHRKLDGQFIVCFGNGLENVCTYKDGEYIKRPTRYDTESSYGRQSTSTRKRKSYEDNYDDGGGGCCGNCRYFENEDGIARCRLHGGGSGIVSESSPGCRDITYG